MKLEFHSTKFFLLFIWLILFVLGANQYIGSLLTYTIFSLVFLVMLMSGLYQKASYGYLFLVVMLWLGFWFKLIIHLIVEYPFVEPIGFFVNTPLSLDNVLHIATIGSIGVMLGKFMHHFSKPHSAMHEIACASKVPPWYTKNRKWIWLAFMSTCIALAIVNAWLGILQVGLVPRTILWWPLNAVISWLVGYGLSLGIATLLWWDISLGRNISVVVYFVLLEAAAVTVSLLSRGAYIFQVIPQFVALFTNRTGIVGWSRKNIILVCMAFIVLFILTNPFVNAFRNLYYSGVPVAFIQKDGTIDQDESVSNLEAAATKFVKFSVDRWIGLEGVMAVSAYPEKNLPLFIQGIEERAEIGRSTLYQEICQAHYRFVDMEKFQFASLPGAIGFFYFSGNLWIVGIGMIVLVLAMLISESVIHRLIRNPLLNALWGGAVANAIVQLGSAPRGLLFYFFEMSCGLAAIFFVQSKYFSKILLKSAALINVKNRV